MSRAERAAAAGAVALVGAHLFAATAFVGDDHLFLAFARLEPNPLSAFVSDRHGGEYWRPVPMLVWWIVARAGGGATWPFAALSLALHGACAALLAAVLTGLGRSRLCAATAAAFFFLAAATRETTYWFAASTDLLAAAFTLASLWALGHDRLRTSLAAAAVAFLSKESALALPLLVALVQRHARPGRSWRLAVRRAFPHAALAAVCLAVRFAILGGLGGSGDERASLPARALQIGSGLVHAVTGYDLVPEWVAWGAGVAVLVLAARSAVTRRRAGDPIALAPLGFVGLAVLPSFAAGWVVGARYFYLPAAGLAWLAGDALARAQPAARWTALAAVAALGFAAGEARRPEIATYERRVAAARRAVVDGAQHGRRVFHVDGGIKDLDLAVKEFPDVAALVAQPLVLADVPTSFVDIPDDLRGAADFLVARPPLPPGGAYRFGSRSIVGLARRGDDPGLDDVLAHFPDIRFIRLRTTSGGPQVLWRDLTEEIVGRIRSP